MTVLKQRFHIVKPMGPRRIPGDLHLLFDSANPAALHMHVAFAPLLEPRCYDFARVLLDAALREPKKRHGLGNVQIETPLELNGALRFVVSVPKVSHGHSGWETFLISRGLMEDYMTRTFVMSPAAKDSEAYDVDKAIEQLLGVGE